MSIAQNIALIQEKIAAATKRSGRDASSVRLMAVSKFHPIEEIQVAYNAGIRLFGENRVQEACEKFSNLSLPDAELHMIGSLQRNKVKRILPLVDCIQSIDRIELLDEIAKHSSKENFVPSKKNIKLLFELHTGEESKTGFVSELDLEAAIDYAIRSGLFPAGFMTMAPFSDNVDLIRHSFVTLRETAARIQKNFSHLDLSELSMGMSNDFEIAIEEGSTLVRVGTAIFGTRSYGVNQ